MHWCCPFRSWELRSPHCTKRKKKTHCTQNAYWAVPRIWELWNFARKEHVQIFQKQALVHLQPRLQGAKEKAREYKRLRIIEGPSWACSVSISVTCKKHPSSSQISPWIPLKTDKSASSLNYQNSELKLEWENLTTMRALYQFFTSRLVTSISATGSVDVVLRRSYGKTGSPSSSSASPSFTSSCIVRDSILLLINFSLSFVSGFCLGVSGLTSPMTTPQIKKIN